MKLLVVVVAVVLVGGHVAGLPDPVAFWPLDSEELLKDTSGNSNDGVNGGGAVLVSDAEGTLAGAYQFTRSATSYIEFPNNGAYDTRYSITMLMYLYPQNVFGPTFNFKRDAWGVHMYSGTAQHFVRFCKRTSLAFTNYLSVNKLQLNKWNFIAASYNYETGEAKLWIEDEVVASTNIGQIELATNYEARMGVRQGDSRYLNGMVTCMQVYDRELTPAEMLEAESKCKMEKVAVQLPTVDCNQGDLTSKMVQFAGTQSSYIKYDRSDIPDLERFTACWWAQTDATANNYRTIFSYLTANANTGSLYARSISNLVMYVNNGATAGSSISIQHGLWHHVCATWSNVVGRYQFYKDGGLTYTNVNLRANQVVAGGGLLILGGRLHTNAGTLYAATYSYQGNIAAFGLWNKVISSEQIQAMAASGCASDTCGNAIAWTSFPSSGFSFVETPATTLACGTRNENCENGEFEDKVLVMDSTNAFSYAQVFQTIPDMTAFTVCSWVKSIDTAASKYLMTYRSSNINTGSIYVYNPNAVRLYVNNLAGTPSAIAINYGLWHHLCITWASEGGRYQYFKDGNLMTTAENLRAGVPISGGGTLIIGQWQASIGSGFNKVYAFNHEITEFNIWGTVKDSDAILTMAGAPCEGSCGDIVSWQYFRSSDITQNVVMKDSDILCSPIATVCEGGDFEGRYWHFDSTAEYTYATIDRDFRDFWSFTACWWMSSPVTAGTYHNMFSYFAMRDSVGSIRVENPFNMRVAIGNQWGAYSSMAVNYGMWHHVCLTWTSDGGVYKIYRDGGMAYTQPNYSANKVLRGGGKLIIGQRQTGLGTGFSRTYSYLGDISDFNLWNSVLDAEVIEGFVANRGCDNGCGNILSWSDFTTSDTVEITDESANAVCKDRVTTCGEGELDDKKWTLESSSSQFSYATARQLIPTLQAFSVCMWVKTTTTSVSPYLFTYRTSNVNTGSIYLNNPVNLKLTVDNAAAAVSGLSVNYGLWFHVCQTWTTAGGNYQYYKDASMRKAGTNLRANYEIQGGGSLILGQWQAFVGGRFTTTYSYNGEITKFNMWSKVLSQSEIEQLYTEPCGHFCGDVVSWSFFRSDDIASINVADHGLQCEEEELVCEAGSYTNKTLSFDSSVEFTYASAPADFVDFWAFTACWWMRTNDVSGTGRAVFSYFASGDNPGSIIVQTAINLRACIKNVWATPSSVSVAYGIWHHVCVTWTSDGGLHEVYRNGGRSFSQTNFRPDVLLRGGGKLVIGQRQTTTGTYNRAYSYIGELSDFNMWDSVLLSSHISDFAENRGCDNGCGDLINWSDFTSSDLTEVEVSDADAVCQPRVTCEDGEFDGKVLVVDSTDDFGVVQSFQTMPDLTKFTMCWWVRSTDSVASSYLVSYVHTLATGSILIYNPNSVLLKVNNLAGVASTMRVNYGLWHHVCITWESGGGNYFYYKDGIMTKTYHNLRTGATILGGGSLMLGQYQSRPGAGLNKVYSFDHEVSKFNIWSEVLQNAEITKLANDACDPSCGDAISWSYFRSSDISSAVSVKDSDIACGPELPLCNGGEYDGKKWGLDNTAVHSYVRSSRTLPDLFQFTVCTWLKTTDIYTYATLFSYSAVGFQNAIMFWNFNNMQLYVNNAAGTGSTLKVNYDKWTHLCVSWDRSGGAYNYYHDGAFVKSGANLATNKIVHGNGNFIIGGRLSAVGGSLLTKTYFIEGEITNFNMWSTLLPEDKIERLFLEGCLNGCGDILSWASFTSDEVTEIAVADSELECRYEPQCGGGPYENSTLLLDSTSTWSYVQTTRAVPDLDQFTMCWWMRTTDAVAYRRSLVSYFAPGAGYYSSIWVEYPTNLRMWVKGTAGPLTGMKVNYGLWHHVCFTWNSNGGTYKAYKDGELRYSSVNLRSFETIGGNGVLVLGQRQTSYGGGFHKYYAYYGELTNFNWWSDSLDADQIKSMAVAPCDSDCGDIMMWSILTAFDVVNAVTQENEIPCSPEVPKCYGGEFKRKVWEFDSTAEYTYADVDKTIRDQDALTISFWMKTTDATNYPRTLVSYFALGDSYGSIVLEYVHNMRLWIGNQAGGFSSMQLNYGLWHHVCVTWTTVEGRYQYFKDATLAYSQVNLRKNLLIRGGGHMVIGQKQTGIETGFTRNRAYIGKLTNFNVWSEVISQELIEAMAQNGCLTGCGNLVWWPYFTTAELTEVNVVDSDIECVEKDKCFGGTYKGKTWRLDNTVDWSYASVPKQLPDMTEFSICMWMKTYEDPRNYYQTAFNYFADGDWYGSIVLMFPRNLRVYLRNQWSQLTSKKVDDGVWHYLCVTWSSEGGVFKLYDKGSLQHSSSGLATGKTIKGAGSLVIGQHQLYRPGNFHRTYSFNGQIMNFNMWSSVYSGEELSSSDNMCKGGCGDLMSWHEFTYFDVTRITTEDMRCKTNPDGSIDLEEGTEETTEAPVTEELTEAPQVTTMEPLPPTEVVVTTAEPPVTTEEAIATTEEGCVIPDGTSNAAGGGLASQSSVRGGGRADKAIDGNADSNMSEGKSCSRTLEERDPWWKVDLGRATDVYKITITNRQDCCTTDIIGAEVRVGNSETLAENVICGARITESDTAQENIEIICACGEPLTGRYVSVQLPEVTRSLTLCEVNVGAIAIATEPPEECVVPSGLVNSALGKTATQSSDAGSASASRAVDGNKNSDFTQRSCSKTSVETDPWWQVDLGSTMDVYQVTITNRQDCCAEKILNAEVRVGDSDNFARHAICGAKVGEEDMLKETITIICACGDGLSGRYVSIQLVGESKPLTLCEVEVWTETGATIAPPPPTTPLLPVVTTEFFTTAEPCILPEDLADVIHAGTAVQQSSTRSEYVAARAVDGNKNSDLSQGSCSMTRKEFEPYFVVDLGESRDIHQVTITNRQDCCAFRMKNAVIRVGNNPDHTQNSICGGPLPGRRAKVETIPVLCGCDDPMPGRYISVQLFNRTQVLSICEIEALAKPSSTPPPPPLPPAVTVPTTPFFTTEEPCILPENVVNIVTPSTSVEQSSTKSVYEASRAIDGNTNGVLADGSCSMTLKESQPWLHLDLGQTRQIHQVTLTNRQDCCAFRLKNALIRVGDSPNHAENPVCGNGPLSGRVAKQPTVNIVCGCDVPMSGRYVSVQLIDVIQMLTLCEVQVFAAP